MSGRREMLWEHKLTSKCFHSLHPDFHSHLYNSVETWKTSFLFYLENTALKKENCFFLLSKCKFVPSYIMLTACATVVMCF